MQPNPEALAQQLYLVSLALERALGEEDWVESNALFASRQSLLDRLSTLPIVGRTTELLELVRLHDEKIEVYLRGARHAIAQEMTSISQGRRAAKAYLH